jgi:hypothetical protein
MFLYCETTFKMGFFVDVGPLAVFVSAQVRALLLQLTPLLIHKLADTP